MSRAVCSCVPGAVHHGAEAHPEVKAGGVPDRGCCVYAAPHHQICKAGAGPAPWLCAVSGVICQQGSFPWMCASDLYPPLNGH